ncbi:proteasome subunit beta [Candidatus Woesearchaeota archaeon]|nr:proteasome subunit beta [Candidatus Woesearchaeota archaeon]
MQDFFSYLSAKRPDLLPCGVGRDVGEDSLPHGTTVIGVVYGQGVLLAGDRLATSGGKKMRYRADKIEQVDSQSAIAYAGTLATCVQMAKIIQVSQEVFRKLNKRLLSLAGKASSLSQMIRKNLPAALDGLAFVPVLAGYNDGGVLYSFDIAGHAMRFTDYAQSGSGGGDAAAVLKQQWRPELGRDDAVGLALKALKNAADEDSATGGLSHDIPLVYSIDKSGVSRLEDEVIRGLAE